MVDRPESGRGRDHDRKAAVDREVPHEVVHAQGDEEPADALADQELAGRTGGLDSLVQSPDVDRLTGHLRSQMRGNRGLVPVGRDLVVSLS